MKKSYIVIFICCVFVLSSCSFQKRVTFPTLGTQVVKQSDKQTFLNNIIKNQKQFLNVRTLSDVFVVEKDQGFKFRYLFVYDKNNVRIEAFPPDAFLSLHILVQNKGQVQNKGHAVFLDRQQKIVVISNDIKNILQELWGEQVDYKELMELFAGNNLLENSSIDNYDFYIFTNNESKSFLQLVSKDRSKYYEFNMDKFNLVDYEIWNQEDLSLKIIKEENLIAVIVPDSKLYMNFKITKQEFDSKILDKIFTINIPKNYKQYKK